MVDWAKTPTNKNVNPSLSPTSRWDWVRAPNDAHFVHFWHARTKIHPLHVRPMHGVDPLNFLVRVVFIVLNLVLCISLKKWEYFPHHLCFVPNLLHPLSSVNNSVAYVYFIEVNDYTWEPDMYKFTSATQVPPSTVVTVVAIPSSQLSFIYIYHHHHHQSLNREGRWAP